MNKQEKIAWGKQMAGIYTLKKEINSDNKFECVSDGVIYALENGVIPVIDELLSTPEIIEKRDLDAVYEILDFYNEEELENLKGYYDIEKELERSNIDRSKAIVIFTYLYNAGMYTKQIDKFDSSHSPTECRSFHLD